MKIRVQVYLDGLRDKTHHSEGVYEVPHFALTATHDALNEPAVSEVRLVKLADKHDAA